MAQRLGMIEHVKRNFADIRLTHPYLFLGTTLSAIWPLLCSGPAVLLHCERRGFLFERLWADEESGLGTGEQLPHGR